MCMVSAVTWLLHRQNRINTSFLRFFPVTIIFFCNLDLVLIYQTIL
nr:MAG TPA: hypothetical protein [Caudoviricetes sp.]